MIDPHTCKPSSFCSKVDAPCSICMTTTPHADWFVLRHPDLTTNAMICRTCAENPTFDAVTRIRANWDRASV